MEALVGSPAFRMLGATEQRWGCNGPCSSTSCRVAWAVLQRRDV